ncbi:MAG: hypothetical protein IT285_08225 [Bdellovibrionales bacterium]|nr:hypothetical protein [Bdellovibrionales bacterium]
MKKPRAPKLCVPVLALLAVAAVVSAPAARAEAPEGVDPVAAAQVVSSFLACAAKLRAKPLSEKAGKSAMECADAQLSRAIPETRRRRMIVGASWMRDPSGAAACEGAAAKRFNGMPKAAGTEPSLDLCFRFTLPDRKPKWALVTIQSESGKLLLRRLAY